MSKEAPIIITSTRLRGRPTQLCHSQVPILILPLRSSGTSLGPSQGPDFGEQSYLLNQLSYGLGLALKSLWHTKWKETFKFFLDIDLNIDKNKVQSTLGFATMGKAANLGLATRNAVTDLF